MIKCLVNPPLCPPDIWRVDPLPLREGALTLDTLQLSAGWFNKRSKDTQRLLYEDSDYCNSRYAQYLRMMNRDQGTVSRSAFILTGKDGSLIINRMRPTVSSGMSPSGIPNSSWSNVNCKEDRDSRSCFLQSAPRHIVRKQAGPTSLSLLWT